jgi:hypothetical protein
MLNSSLPWIEYAPVFTAFHFDQFLMRLKNGMQASHDALAHWLHVIKNDHSAQISGMKSRFAQTHRVSS